VQKEQDMQTHGQVSTIDYT